MPLRGPCQVDCRFRGAEDDDGTRRKSGTGHPCGTSSAHSADHARDLSRPVNGLRLLALDDDPNILALLEGYFAGLGWHVEACLEADRGLELLQEERWDVVISDLHFTPARAGEGFELITRARLLQPEAAVVLFTAAGGASVLAEARRRGADAVVLKPISLGELRDAAIRAMRRS